MDADVSHLRELYQAALERRSDAVDRRRVVELFSRLQAKAPLSRRHALTGIYLNTENPARKSALLRAIRAAAERNALEVQGFTIETGKGPDLSNLPGLFELLRDCEDGGVGPVVVDEMESLGNQSWLVSHVLAQAQVRLLVLSAGSAILPEARFYPLELRPDPIAWHEMCPSGRCPVCDRSMRPKRKDSDRRR